MQAVSAAEERASLGAATEIVDALRHDHDAELEPILARYIGHIGDPGARGERLGRLIKILGRMSADLLDSMAQISPQAAESYIVGMHLEAERTD